MGDRLKLGSKMVSIPTVAFSDDDDSDGLFAKGKDMHNRHLVVEAHLSTIWSNEYKCPMVKMNLDLGGTVLTRTVMKVDEAKDLVRKLMIEIEKIVVM